MHTKVKEPFRKIARLIDEIPEMEEGLKVLTDRLAAAKQEMEEATIKVCTEVTPGFYALEGHTYQITGSEVTRLEVQAVEK